MADFIMWFHETGKCSYLCQNISKMSGVVLWDSLSCCISMWFCFKLQDRHSIHTGNWLW